MHTLTENEKKLIVLVKKDFLGDEANNFKYFYGSRSVFSNFYESKFIEDGILFNTNEKYITYKKAMLFNDTATAERILLCSHPSDCKALGRSIKNFDPNIWKDKRLEVVYSACYLKFSQNPKLKRILEKNKGYLLVETSKYDSLWGIGLDIYDPLINFPLRWKGANLLGYILVAIMNVIT